MGQKRRSLKASLEILFKTTSGVIGGATLVSLWQSSVEAYYHFPDDVSATETTAGLLGTPVATVLGVILGVWGSTALLGRFSKSEP